MVENILKEHTEYYEALVKFAENKINTSDNSGDVKCLYGVKDCDNFGSKCNGCTPKYYKQIT
jgi:hypothetical protein